LPCWLYTLYLVQNISDSRDDINHFTHTRLLNLFEAARKSSLLHQELWELAGKD
jgi:hypothetical protein